MQELEQAARLALEALEDAHYTIEHLQDIDKRKIAMKALQEAIIMLRENSWITPNEYNLK